MTALYMGAGYHGGAYLFFHVIFGSRWHRVAAGFLPVTMFTISMLLATILHWDRFDFRHFPFLLWFGLYIATPFLVPWLWLRNRDVDPGKPEASDVVVPSLARRGLQGLGVVMLGFAVASFAIPEITFRLWPWALTPLTARVLGGWFALLGVGGLVISADSRWSAWKAGLESIALWHLLVLVGAVIRRQDFNNGSLINWYLLSVLLVLIGMVVLYIAMEMKSRETTR